MTNIYDFEVEWVIKQLTLEELTVFKKILNLITRQRDVVIKAMDDRIKELETAETAETKNIK